MDKILHQPGGLNINNLLPAAPFFNAVQIFASNIQVISFQTGAGARFLTEYAQSAASVNYHDLFYHSQGATRDRPYYIIAILPITTPVLAETGDAGTVLRSGRVPYPYVTDADADMQAYYASDTDLLKATSPDAVTPTMDQLDLLIQSMRITP